MDRDKLCFIYCGDDICNCSAKDLKNAVEGYVSTRVYDGIREKDIDVAAFVKKIHEKYPITMAVLREAELKEAQEAKEIANNIVQGVWNSFPTTPIEQDLERSSADYPELMKALDEQISLDLCSKEPSPNGSSSSSQ